MQPFPSRPSRFIVLFLFAAALWPALCPAALTWQSQRIELVAKPSDKEITGVFHFTNSGDRTVTITSAQSSCGCTTASLTKNSYAPGESGEIKAIFSIGDRVGVQEKSVFVVTDDNAAPPIHLALQVTIPELLCYSPRLLLWNVGGERDEKAVPLSANDKLTITGIALDPALPKEVTARIEPVEAGKKYRLLVRPVAVTQVTNVAVAGTATFADGTIQPFKIYALVR